MLAARRHAAHARGAGDAGRPGHGRPVRPAGRGAAGRPAAAGRRARRSGRTLATAQRRALGVTAGDRGGDHRAPRSNWPEEATLREAALRVPSDGADAMRRDGRAACWTGSAWSRAARAEHWDEWRERVPDQGRASRARSSGFVSQALADSASRPAAPLSSPKPSASSRVEDACCALRVAAVSAALLTLAAPGARRLRRRARRQSGLLDYDDLIGRTSSLLVDPGAAWVLYKLDGGLDHLLLDEVQDTAPAQWRIAHALTEEFFAGAGAREAAPHGVRRRRPQAVDLFVPGRRHRRSSTAPARGSARACAAAGQALARRDGSTCRSAPPRRCWRWWIAVFADPLAARRRGGRGRDADATSPTAPSMPARSSSGRWRPLPETRRAAALDGAGAEPRPDLRAAASGGDAGATGSRARSAAA